MGGIMKKEYWKPVVGYEGLYEVSNFGRVKSIPRNGTVKYARILKPVTNRYGYSYVILCKNGKVKSFLVHRLVAEAFIQNNDNLPCVNHKDECKTNNNVENLEWCSEKYNCNFGTRNERVSKKLSKSILQYTLDGEFVKEWKSAKQAEREGGFSSANITACCRGERKTHQNFIWKYK